MKTLQDMVEAALRILGLQPEDISDTDTLISLGMDSMQMVEASH